VRSIVREASVRRLFRTLYDVKNLALVATIQSSVRSGSAVELSLGDCAPPQPN
jgi:hypothetical protein